MTKRLNDIRKDAALDRLKHHLQVAWQEASKASEPHIRKRIKLLINNVEVKRLMRQDEDNRNQN